MPRARVSRLLWAIVVIGPLGGCPDEGGENPAVVAEANRPSTGELCRNAPLLDPTVTVAGTTEELANGFGASCGAGAGGPDQAYALDVAQRALVRIHLQADHHAIVHLHRGCPGEGTEVACSDHFRGLIEVTLEPGRYYAVVDGQSLGASGPYALTMSQVALADERPPAAVCAAASPLPEGDVVSFDVLNGPDRFPGSCLNNRPGAVLHRIEVTEPTRLDVRVPQGMPSGALTIARGCGEQRQELVCAQFGRRATGEYDLDPGSYILGVVSAPTGAPHGPIELSLAARPVRTLVEECREHPVLTDRSRVDGDNTTGSSRRVGVCQEGADGPESIYRIVLARPTTVSLALVSETDAALYLREECVSAAGDDVACQRFSVADATSDLAALEQLDRQPRRGLLQAELEAGEYWVYVDSNGRFQLTPYIGSDPPEELTNPAPEGAIPPGVDGRPPSEGREAAPQIGPPSQGYGTGSLDRAMPGGSLPSFSGPVRTWDEGEDRERAVEGPDQPGQEL